MTYISRAERLHRQKVKRHRRLADPERWFWVGDWIVLPIVLIIGAALIGMFHLYLEHIW
jgi:hypothetical protein